MPYDPDIYLAQVGLKELGFDPGPLDGILGNKTRDARSSWLRSTEKYQPLPVGYPDRPEPTTDAIISVFGKMGVKGGHTPPMAFFEPPYPMVFSWGGYVERIGCHELVAKPMENALKELVTRYGYKQICEWGMHIYAGCYNPRLTRGGSPGSWSRHAWAIAFDFNPNKNGNRTPWRDGMQGQPGWASMPMEVIDIMLKHGFRCGFSHKNGTRRDMMHFQYTL